MAEKNKKSNSREQASNGTREKSASQRADRIGSQAVGYGRPPLHGRFKLGRSGNPRGRPKQSRNLKTIIQQALIDRITVREGDRRRSITRLEGVVLRQIEGALKGSDRAALATLKIAAQVGLLDGSETAFEAPALTPAEQQLMQNLLEKASSQSKPKRRRKKNFEDP